MKKILSGICMIFTISACENVDIVEFELDHAPKFVVQAELVENQLFEGVKFTKTLPIGEEYSIEKTEIKNAVTYLKINGTQVVTLKYFEKGIYKPIGDLWIHSGNRYELFARIDEELIYASTIVPYKPSIESTNFTDDNYIEANINSRNNEVYGSVWIVNTSTSPASAIIDDDFHSIVGASEDNNKKALSRTSILPETYLTPNYAGFIFVQVYAFDSAYREYFNTKENNQPIQDSFAQGGGLINWNVQGNNSIGLFIGMAKGDIINAN